MRLGRRLVRLMQPTPGGNGSSRIELKPATVSKAPSNQFWIDYYVPNDLSKNAPPDPDLQLDLRLWAYNPVCWGGILGPRALVSWRHRPGEMIVRGRESTMPRPTNPRRYRG